MTCISIFFFFFFAKTSSLFPSPPTGPLSPAGTDFSWEKQSQIFHTFRFGARFGQLMCNWVCGVFLKILNVCFLLWSLQRGALSPESGCLPGCTPLWASTGLVAGFAQQRTAEGMPLAAPAAATRGDPLRTQWAAARGHSPGPVPTAAAHWPRQPGILQLQGAEEHLC